MFFCWAKEGEENAHRSFKLILLKSLTYKHYYKTFNKAFYIYKSALLTFSEQQDVTERG